jgi:hypothetical protein
VVHGEHEADVSTLVARGGAPPRSEQYSENDADDCDQRDHQYCLAVVLNRHQHLL